MDEQLFRFLTDRLSVEEDILFRYVAFRYSPEYAPLTRVVERSGRNRPTVYRVTTATGSQYVGTLPRIRRQIDLRILVRILLEMS